MLYALMLVFLSAAFCSAGDPDTTEELLSDVDIIINEQDSSDTISGADTSNGGKPAGLSKKKATRFTAFGFGPANLDNIESAGLAYNFYGGSYWDVARYAGLKLLTEATTDFDHSILAGISIGANLYPVPSDISPFIGGDMGFGYTRASGDNFFGLSFGGSAGFQFFRTSDVQLNAEVKAYVIVDRSGKDYPANYMARLGIFF
ncbi:MAG: hypothetical protein GX556_16290 [Fibrobacter sp.]|nr:hypothetical protein [Fibrobacter sp.]